MVQNVQEHASELGCTADWAFFETGHGQGPVDGIGGTAKRQVMLSVYRVHEILNSPLGIFEVRNNVISPKITLLYSGKDEVNVVGQALTRWESAPAAASIRSAGSHPCERPVEYGQQSAAMSPFIPPTS